MKLFVNLIKFFYKKINNLYFKTLKNGIAGHLRVFIDEPIIIESVKSIIDGLDKLYICFYENLSCSKKIQQLKETYPDKIILHPVKKLEKHFSYYINKSYKQIKYK